MNYSKLSKQRKINLLSYLLIIWLGLLVYSNSYQSGFHYDDSASVIGNLPIKDITNIRAIFDEFNTRFVFGVSLSLNYYWGKLDAFGFHLVNIMIHILSSILVFILVNLTFKTPALVKTSLGKESANIVALFSALIFVTHPVQTEGVTFITQRAASLASFFYLSTVVLYVQSRLKSNPVYYGAAIISTLLAMFTKEISITIPFMLILYELFFFGFHKRTVLKRSIVLLPFLLSLTIIPFMLSRTPEVTLSVARIAYVEEADQDNASKVDIFRAGGTEGISRGEYLLTEFNVIRTYIRLLFFPLNQNIDYDYPYSRSLFDPGTFLSLLFILAIFLIAVILFKRQRLISFGIVWFFIAISLESSFIPIGHVIAEYRLYLAMAGFSIAFSMVSYLIIKDTKRLTIFLSVLVCFFSLLSYYRNNVWIDDVTLWEDAAMKSPGKVRPSVNLGIAYNEAGDYKKAVIAYQNALQLVKNPAKIYNNLGSVYLNAGDYNKAAIVFQNALQMGENPVKIYNNLGSVYLNAGDIDKAIKYLTEAIRINPDYDKAYNNLGMAYGLKGDHKKLVQYCNKAIELNAYNVDAYYNLGVSYAKNGDLPNALKQVERLRGLYREDLAELIERIIEK